MFKVGKIQTVYRPLGPAVQPVKFLNQLNQYLCLQAGSPADLIEVVRIYNRKVAKSFKSV